jgi:hypothetical protein
MGDEAVRYLILVAGFLSAIALPEAYADDASEGRNLFIKVGNDSWSGKFRRW